MNGPTGFEVRVEDYAGVDAQTMIAAVQQEYVERYGSPDDAPIDRTEFTPPSGLFMVGYLDGEAVAMGGLRRHGPGEVEVKRMYVAPAARGRGLSRLILVALEERARALGASRVVLETGMRQPEAIALYTTSGYALIPGYGHYQASPLSRSFAKSLVSE